MKKRKLILQLVGIFAVNVLNAQFFDNAISCISTAKSFGNGITATPTGNSFITGQFYDDIDFSDFNNSLALNSTFGTPCAFVMAEDGFGNAIWSAKWESTLGESAGNDISFDPSTDDVFVCGYFEGQLTIQDGSGTLYTANGIGQRDMFVARFKGTSGTLQEYWIAGSARPDEALGVIVENLVNPGSLGISGYYSDQMDIYYSNGGTPSLMFTHAPTTAISGEDAFGIVTTGGLANVNFVVWAEGNGNNRGTSSGFDSNGNFFWTGSYGHGTDFFDVTASSVLFQPGGPNDQGFVLIFDNAGTFLGEALLSGNGDVVPNDIAVAIGPDLYDGGFVLTGRYTDGMESRGNSGTTIVAPNPCSNLIPQMFIASFDYIGPGGTDPLFLHYSATCSGAEGYSLCYEGTNLDRLFVVGYFDHSGTFNENAPGYSPVSHTVFQTIGGNIVNDRDAILIALNAPYLNGLVSSINPFAGNGGFPQISQDWAKSVYCGPGVTQGWEVFTTGAFTSVGGDFRPFVLNPGGCATGPCGEEAFWGILPSAFLKTNGTVSAEAPLAGHHFSLYPNPGNNQVTLTFGDQLEEGSTIRLMDVNGRVIQQMQTVRELAVVQLDTKELATGMYYISIQAKGQAPLTLKWVKE